MSTERSAPRSSLREGATIESLTGALARHKTAFAAAFLSCVACFTAAAFLIPPRYRAEAVVVAEAMVASTTDESAYVPPQVNAERQLEAIRSRLLRRSLLEGIAAEFGMFPGVPQVSEKELDELRSRIAIGVQGEKTFAIAFEDEQRRRSADVAARLAALLVETAGAERLQRDQATRAFLESQVDTLAADLAKKEAELGRYREEHIQEIPDQVATTLKLLESVQASLADVSKALVDEEARKGGIQREMAELRRQGVSQTVTASPAERRLEELRATLAELELRYTDAHPDVIRTRREIGDLEAAARSRTAPEPASGQYSSQELRYVQLQAELAATDERLARSRSERPRLLEQSAEYQRRIEAAPRHEMAMSAMTREIESIRGRHLALVERLHDATFDEGLGKTNEGALYRVIEAPRVPERPIAPDRLRIVLMGIVAGLILGASVAFLADQMDTSLGTPEEVEALTGLSVLVSIPAHASSREDGGSAIVAIDAPETVAAEQYRILAARLLRNRGGAAPTCLLVTSPAGGEGKTTTAVNLAVALSRMVPEGVLLVDADIGRPRVHAMLGIPQGDGLRRFLESPGDDPMVHCRSHRGIWLLEAGKYSEKTRAALSSPLCQRIFLRLRQRFAYIVIDGPPLLAVAEGQILQHLADTSLLVVRARRTQRQALERALGTVDATRIAGIALNGVDPSTTRAYGYSYVHDGATPARKAAGQ